MGIRVNNVDPSPYDSLIFKFAEMVTKWAQC